MFNRGDFYTVIMIAISFIIVCYSAFLYATRLGTPKDIVQCYNICADAGLEYSSNNSYFCRCEKSITPLKK